MKLVTSGKAAAALGVDPATLWRWQKTGRITPSWVTPGGHARWDVADLRRQLGMTREEAQVSEDDLPVVAAVVTSSQGLLVGQRRDGRPPWTLIAGEMMPGESVEDTARREVKEETELQITTTGELGRRQHPKTKRTMIYIGARPEDESATDVVVADDYELLTVRWVSLAEALELLPGLYGPVREHLEQILGGNE